MSSWRVLVDLYRFRLSERFRRPAYMSACETLDYDGGSKNEKGSGIDCSDGIDVWYALC